MDMDDLNSAFRNSSYDYMLSISDPNVNKRLDNEEASHLVSKLPTHYGECPICYDDENARKIVNLPCCNAEICKSCIINTLTQNTKDCPMCRGNLDENIRNFKIIPKSNPAKSKHNNNSINNSINNSNNNNNSNSISNNNNNNNNNLKFIPIETPNPYILYTPQHKLENGRIDDWLKRLSIDRTFTSTKTADGLKIKIVKHKFTNLNNLEEQKPISFVFHNNRTVNRFKFYSFIKEFKELLDNSSFIDSTEVFKGIHSLCKTFTDEYKNYKGDIPDVIFNKIYTQLKTIIIAGIKA